MEVLEGRYQISGPNAFNYFRKAGYSKEIINAIHCLTWCDGEGYDQFINRVTGNTLARRVKIVDLKDNSDLGKITEPDENNYKRLQKYRRALAELAKDGI